MKKRTVWIVVALIFLLLVARLIFLQFNHLKREKSWYISGLHYRFSARIDSVVRPGRAMVTVTHGELDPKREWQLKGGLEYHGVLHLIIARGEWYDVRVPSQALVNDSLYVNSDNDQLSLYRHGELVVSRPLSDFLRQRPF